MVAETDTAGMSNKELKQLTELRNFLYDHLLLINAKDSAVETLAEEIYFRFCPEAARRLEGKNCPICGAEVMAPIYSSEKGDLRACRMGHSWPEMAPRPAADVRERVAREWHVHQSKDGMQYISGGLGILKIADAVTEHNALLAQPDARNDVPREPTEAMLRACWPIYHPWTNPPEPEQRPNNYADMKEKYSAVWRAMWDASQQRPERE